MKELCDRPVPPGMERVVDEQSSHAAPDLETALRATFERLLHVALRELEEQSLTGVWRNFNAFADMTIDSGHKLRMTISGEPPA